MPVNYDEVLTDLDGQIAHYKKEMEELQAARPAIVALRNKFNPVITKPFSGMGATAAIRELLSNSRAWHSTNEIVGLLQDKGWTTDSSEPPRIVASTLSQMKANGFVEKQNDMWRWLTLRSVPETEAPVFRSPGAPNSLSEAILRAPSV
jgi:hypothetical protein